MPWRHRQEKSEMLGTGDDPFFRAVCSCGWRSELVPAQRVHRAWEDHVEETRRPSSAAG